MDLNYLYHRYSVSLHMAQNAGCVSSKLVHRQLADAYALKIADERARAWAVPA